VLGFVALAAVAPVRDALAVLADATAVSIVASLVLEAQARIARAVTGGNVVRMDVSEVVSATACGVVKAFWDGSRTTARAGRWQSPERSRESGRRNARANTRVAVVSNGSNPDADMTAFPTATNRRP